MLNKKAQALIEFVLLLPIIIVIIFSSIDLFNAILTKNDITNKLDDELSVVRKNNETVQDLKNRLEKKNLKVEISEKDNYLTVKVSKKIKWLGPTTELVLKNYKVSVKRVIPLE